MINLFLFDNRSFQRGVPAWKEALWWLARSSLFATWFPVPSGVKVVALRVFGAKVGRGVVIRSRVNITFPWRVAIGDHVWIGDEVTVLSLAAVSIGSNCCLSQRAFVCTGTHDFRQSSFDLITMPVRIEEGCWIGAQAFIGPGVTVHRNTVCGAGTVVVRNVGPHAVVTGNPATQRPNPGSDGPVK